MTTPLMRASPSIWATMNERGEPSGTSYPPWRRSHGAHLQIAVLTNGADYQQRAKLAACGLSELVGPVFSSDVIGFAKPDPRAYRHVCEQLRVNPSHVVHVGDRYDLDVVAARAAGLNAIYLDRLDIGPEDEASRICSLVELPVHLGLTRIAD
jgi:putative hydrolase of the HAD superfamily